MEGSFGVDANTLNAFAKSPYLREVARFPKDVVYEYTMPIEVAHVLTGRISEIKINPSGQLLVYLQFSGDGGRGWINPQYPRNIKMRTFLHMEGKGEKKIGPVETEFHFPQIIIPENPVEQVIGIDGVAYPGA